MLEVVSMKRIITSLTILVAIFSVSLPDAGHAQAASEGPQAICLIERRSYKRGDRGTNVSILQMFLKNRGFFSEEATGYFGGLTESAVTRFQFDSGIITSPTQGGVWGQRTWSYVAGRFCAAQPVIQPTAPQCPTPPLQPVNTTCPSGWQKTSDSNGCHVGWSCVTYTTNTNTTSLNRPPVITGVQGPLSVVNGVSNTWTIRATDPEGDALSYKIVWGDEGSSLTQTIQGAEAGTSYGSSAVSSHKYLTSGTYTLLAYVKDTANGITKVTLSIVSGEQANTTTNTPTSYSC
ncbi:MAG: hypothetical protein RIQ56_288, partial [Candidatus Parcubacteria bacterium]